MKNFIFRFPTTKKSKVIGYALLQAANACIETAKTCKDEEGKYTIEGVKLIQKGCQLWNQAANRLGFRNLEDMEKYREIHGKI